MSGLWRGRCPNQRTAAFLIEESVLRNGFGGPAVMRGQCVHLAEVTTWSAVSLGVIPASCDRGLASPVEDFWIFDNDQGNVELVSGFLTVTQPTEIALYAQVFARLSEIAGYGDRVVVTAGAEHGVPEHADYDAVAASTARSIVLSAAA